MKTKTMAFLFRPKAMIEDSNRIAGTPRHYQQRTFSCSHLSLICLAMVRCAVICWAAMGRASVETKPGCRSFVTKVIVSALGAGHSIFVTRFVGSVRSRLCQLLLLVGAIAKDKPTAGTVPCSKM
jgi:hypothetical protein